MQTTFNFPECTFKVVPKKDIYTFEFSSRRYKQIVVFAIVEF